MNEKEVQRTKEEMDGDLILPSLFPRHECSLYLSHNPHKSFHQSIEQWANDLLLSTGENPMKLGWHSEEQRKKAIETNSFWELQWYPDTPISFIRLLACDLGLLLAEARKEE